MFDRDFLKDEKEYEILNTNFLKIFLFSKKLNILNRRAKSNQIIKYSDNLKHDIPYEIVIKQLKKDLRTKVSFGRRNKRLSEKEFDNKTDICEFERGNQIHFGCLVEDSNNPNKPLKFIDPNANQDFKFSKFFKGSISDIKLKIDRSMYDNVIESDLETVPCDIASLEESKPLVTKQNIDIELINYIEITCDITLFNQLNRKYMVSSSETDKDLINDETSIDKENKKRAVDEFFDKMENKEEIFTNFKTAILNKNNLVFIEGYNNLEYTDHDKTYHLFNYKENENRLLVDKMMFLDQEFLKNKNTENDQIYIFIFGINEVNYNFLRCHKPIFIIIYKNDNEDLYQFEQIPINLDIFYIHHREFNKILIDNEGDINTSYQDFFRNPPQEKSEVFTKNFYRLYDSNIDLGNITVKVFKNKSLEKTEIVRFKQNDKVKCEYIPYGDTVFDCVEHCMNENKTSCSRTECKQRCSDCDNEINCKWTRIQENLKNKFIPSKINLKGFSGDKSLKLTWIKPISPYNIEKYYILLTSPTNKNKFNLYSYSGNEDLVEFYLQHLNNDEPYTIYLFSKNKMGISEPSNKVTLIPQNKKVLKMENLSKNSYSNSVQNYYKTNPDRQDDIISLNQKQINQMEMLEELNGLKEILIKKISFNE